MSISREQSERMLNLGLRPTPANRMLALLASALLFACAARSRDTVADGAGGASTARESIPAADAGTARACTADRTQDIAPCVEECDRNIAFACAVAATRAEHGEAAARDLPRAASLYERACELRDSSSCVSAARMHAAGMGVSPNRAKQMELLAEACKLGDSAACSIPAKAYAAGRGVARDPQRARELWERACTGGVEMACEAVADAGL